MRRTLTLVLAAVILLGGASGSASAVSPSVIPVYIDSIVEDLNIKESMSAFRLFTSDAKGKYTGMLFASGDTYRVYKNGKLIHTEKTTNASEKPDFFRMTHDGHLLYTLDPYNLYVDGKRISTTTNTYSYNVGLELQDMYFNGRIAFIDSGTKIREYDIRTGRTKTLHSHGGAIAYMRRKGGSIVYSVKQNLPETGYYLYRDGERVTFKPLADPFVFAVTSRKDVYYFARADKAYALYKNEAPVQTGDGVGGLVYISPRNTVYHAAALDDAKQGKPLTIGLYRASRKIKTPVLFDIEDRMAFKGTMYAVRVRAASADPFSYRLLKNGRLIGETFPLDVYDNLGIAFGPDSKTYMRNWVNGRWVLYEDGTPVLEKAFGDVAFFRADDKTVTVYGTRPAR